MKQILAGGVVLGGLLFQLAGAAAPQQLTVYSIDVEGGQSTLVVSPAGESMLIDAGFPGPRDAERIAAAVKDAGLTKIDHFLNTHLHSDHFGSLPDLIKTVPVMEVIDNGTLVETRQGSIDAFQKYATARDTIKRHVVPKAGDKLEFKGAEVTVVTANGKAITKPLVDSGPNPMCKDYAPQADDPSEDARSIGTVIRFGQFRMVDFGDLTWNKEHDLACPANVIGPVDLYIATRHALNGAGLPALVQSLRPKVAVIPNAGKKGASRDHWLTIKNSPGLVDIWQIHLSESRPPMVPLGEKGEQGGPEVNTANDRIANLDDSTSFAIKVQANNDGSFVVTNTRNGVHKEYRR